MHRVGRYRGKQFVQSCRRPAIDELREDVGKPGPLRNPIMPAAEQQWNFLRRTS